MSGISLAGKQMAVVYLTREDKDSLFAKNVASGFAAALDEDYFDGQNLVEVFKMPYTRKADYSSKDTLVNLVMDTGKDVIFLFDGLATSQHRRALRLFVYDSMSKQDTVRIFSGVTDISDLSNATESTAVEAGKKAAAKFLSTWSAESMFFYYYDTSDWMDAAYKVSDYKWNAAMKKWLDLAEKSSDKEKKACAAYNLATVSYILGDIELAQKWLDMSDKLAQREFSHNLRIKILNRQLEQ